MGEIAEMMTEGDLCADCGSSLECEDFGIPILYHYCHSDYQPKCNIPHEGKSGYYCERYYNGS